MEDDPITGSLPVANCVTLTVSLPVLSRSHAHINELQTLQSLSKYETTFIQTDIL
jgi:hypothetical protein